MTARAAILSGAGFGPSWPGVLGIAGLVFGSLAAAVAIRVLGLWALFLPMYAALAVITVRSPGLAAGILVLLAVSFEPGAVDPTAPIGDGLWLGPPGMDTLPVGPLEMLLVAVTAMLWWRRLPSDAPRLPAVAWVIPALMVLGFLYGQRKGAPTNLAYHEARGLLFAGVAFAAFRLMAPLDRVRAGRLFVAGTVVMALVLIERYFFVVAPGRTSVPVERAFTHEGPVMLAFAVVAAVVHFVRAESPGRRVSVVLYAALLLVAILVTGRRAATLALLIGALVAVWYLVPRRPALVLSLLVPVMVAGTAYLGVFWSREYGALAQPARAIRSQIDPSPRDYSSDLYREVELDNVLATIDLNPLFGVGFGKPFGTFQQLPDLTAWWPLQLYVTHQNILWLWLKTGFFGITAFLTLWVLAVARCARAIREAGDGVPFFPVVVSAGLFIVFAYASVDTALAETRSAVFAGLLAAAAFTLPIAKEQRR